MFCGSSPGARKSYSAAARDFGAALADADIELVYGGGRIGLMGVLADATLSAGGRAIGVIPRALAEREIAHSGLTQLHVVETMHERKALMAELSQAFVALPGGFGTFEEFFEIVTWSQLGIHRKACALLNVDGYFDPLVALLDHAVEEGFIAGADRGIVVEATGALEAIEKLGLTPAR